MSVRVRKDFGEDRVFNGWFRDRWHETGKNHKKSLSVDLISLDIDLSTSLLISVSFDLLISESLNLSVS